MPTARLRKAFRYPDDSGGEFDHEELDEEEQEFIIQRLQVQNDRRNAEYSVTDFPFIMLISWPVADERLISTSHVA
ncbi:hypothetical protein BDV25DRAFT_144509 [Aspergillus avenaceus]|uniref:Uncharacterized protein n=1 Tax=Aspergillus avenaceus TaxID=36643 RepID=A0A5N6TGU2_ASPAV|nr:hypothetical protein BDV25DRAFT_144509 [Aspergillus avenaceus]